MQRAYIKINNGHSNNYSYMTVLFNSWRRFPAASQIRQSTTPGSSTTLVAIIQLTGFLWCWPRDLSVSRDSFRRLLKTMTGQCDWHQYLGKMFEKTSTKIAYKSHSCIGIPNVIPMKGTTALLLCLLWYDELIVFNSIIIIRQFIRHRNMSRDTTRVPSDVTLQACHVTDWLKHRLTGR